MLKDIYDQAIKKHSETFLGGHLKRQKIVVHKKIPGFFARPYERSLGINTKDFVTKKRIDSGLIFTKKTGISLIV